MRQRAGRKRRSASIPSAAPKPRPPDPSNSPKNSHSPPNLSSDQPSPMVSARSLLSPPAIVRARARANCHPFFFARSSCSKQRRATASSASLTPYRSITGTPAFFT